MDIKEIKVEEIIDQALGCHPGGDFHLLALMTAEEIRAELKEMIVAINSLFCRRFGTEGFGFKEQEEWRHRYGEAMHALGLLEGRFDFATPNE